MVLIPSNEVKTIALRSLRIGHHARGLLLVAQGVDERRGLFLGFAQFGVDGGGARSVRGRRLRAG